MIINLRKNFFLFHKLKFFLKKLNIFSNKNQKDNKKRINNLKKKKQVDQKIFEDAIQAYDLKDFKGANFLIDLIDQKYEKKFFQYALKIKKEMNDDISLAYFLIDYLKNNNFDKKVFNEFINLIEKILKYNKTKYKIQHEYKNAKNDLINKIILDQNETK